MYTIDTYICLCETDIIELQFLNILIYFFESHRSFLFYFRPYVTPQWLCRGLVCSNINSRTIFQFIVEGFIMNYLVDKKTLSFSWLMIDVRWKSDFLHCCTVRLFLPPTTLSSGIYKKYYFNNFTGRCKTNQISFRIYIKRNNLNKVRKLLQLIYSIFLLKFLIDKEWNFIEYLLLNL